MIDKGIRSGTVDGKMKTGDICPDEIRGVYTFEYAINCKTLTK